MTERWCQAVVELYEFQQNSATDRRGNYAQNSIANPITYGSFNNDVPDKYDSQSFLKSTSEGSQHSGSPTRRAQRTSQSPVGTFADVLKLPQSSRLPDETATNQQVLYPLPVEITSETRRKVEEERAVLEAMMQFASLPVSPYLGPMGFPGWQNSIPYTMRGPGYEGSQFGTNIPLGYGMQMGDEGNNAILGIDEFPSLDEIINSMEGLKGMEGGMDGSLGFLDDLGLFNTPL